MPEQIREDKKAYYHRITAGTVSVTSLIEGVVLKHLDSTYPVSFSRSRVNRKWLKVKPHELIEKQKEGSLTFGKKRKVKLSRQ